MRTIAVLCLASVVGLLIIPSQAQVQVVNNLDDLQYDENDRLLTHTLAFPEGICEVRFRKAASRFDMKFGHKFLALGGAAFQDVFGEKTSVPVDVLHDRGCPAVCLEKGSPRALVASPMPHRYKTDEGNIEEFLSSESCGKVEYGFTNYYVKPVDVYWIRPENGERIFNMKLKIGEQETHFIFSFVGHRFEFDDPDTNEVIAAVVVENTGVFGVKNYDIPRPFQPDEVDELVQETLDSEWGRHKKVKRTFSALGFEKGRLPDDLFGSFSTYYYNNRNPPHIVREEWKETKGVFVNYWEIDVNFVQIPWVLKGKWQHRLREMVEAWTGVELETTDMYGMRQYEPGARLLTHVDRHSTHAASLIVNIAQGNLTRPWTIEVHDHADRLHEVVMAPGDIVYYESARCLHGRNTPLQGGHYVNLFTHYRPLNDPDWWFKENPEGTPPPLIDVGECNLVGEPNEYSKGAVVCENSAVGPNLSPSMFTAKSGLDLYSWWRHVSPRNENSVETSEAQTSSTDTTDEL